MFFLLLSTLARASSDTRNRAPAAPEPVDPPPLIHPRPPSAAVNFYPP
ncbi:MAG TPA: hypothetical protein VHL11_13625 [Phototrophicaceae bacterium]|nr:hypothetical protein [Phototrophicaceae bacterium]